MPDAARVRPDAAAAADAARPAAVVAVALVGARPPSVLRGRERAGAPAAGRQRRRRSRSRPPPCSSRSARRPPEWASWPAYLLALRRPVRRRHRPRDASAPGSVGVPPAGRARRARAGLPRRRAARPDRPAGRDRRRRRARRRPARPAAGRAALPSSRASARRASRQTLELGRAYRGTALLLRDLLEEDDEYTGHHTQDVVELSRARRRAAWASSEDVRRETELGALLHDIGKIAHPRRDHQQARPARRRGVGAHEDPHDRGPADARPRRRPARQRRRRRARLARALRRPRLPGRPRRRARSRSPRGSSAPATPSTR